MAPLPNMPSPSTKESIKANIKDNMKDNMKDNIKDSIKARLESVMAPPPSSATNINAAKQWEEVEVTSCFRTGGSMPIPKAAVVIPVYTVQRKELPQHHAEEESLPELKEERLSKLKVSALPTLETLAEGSNVQEECNERAAVFSVTTNLADPPAPPPRVQQCKKHSRCHCSSSPGSAVQE